MRIPRFTEARGLLFWIDEGLVDGRAALVFDHGHAWSPVIGIGVSSHEPGRPKDTRRNIHETGEFVVNLVSEETVGAMIVTAIEFEQGVDELAQAQMATLPSLRVMPPRIATSPVAMECELIKIVELGQDNGLVLGRVLAMYVQDEMVLDAEKHLIDTPRLNLVGRMHGGGWYARTRDLFEAPRIARERWMLREENP